MDLKTTIKTTIIVLLLILSIILLHEVNNVGLREHRLAYVEQNNGTVSGELSTVENNVFMGEYLLAMPFAAILLYLIVKKTNSI